MIAIGLERSGTGFIGRTIDGLSGGLGYAHAYLFFSELRLVHEAHSDFGVRFIDRHPGHDDALHALDIDPEQEKAVLRKCCELAGNGYDFAGVFHHALPLIKEDASRQFCSEANVIALQAALLLPGVIPHQVTPNGLAALIRDGRLPLRGAA